MPQHPFHHRPPRPQSPAGDSFYRRPSAPVGAAPRTPASSSDHAHDHSHDHSHDHAHDHAHDHPHEHHQAEVPHHHHGDSHHHHDDDARREQGRAGRPLESSFSDEKRLVDTIVSLVAERVDAIVQRRVEEIVARHLARLPREQG